MATPHDATAHLNTSTHTHTHAATTGQGVNDHHVEDHDHDGTPTQKLLAANSHESPSADTHHAQSHTHASHTSIGANDHHNQAHGNADHDAAVKTIRIRKPADETITLSLALQDDDDLLFSVAANEVWSYMLSWVISSPTTADFRFNFAAPAGASGFFNSPSFTPLGTYGGADLTQATTTGVELGRVIVGIINNGGTAGQLKFQWAQQTVDAGNTIVRANSFLIAHRIA